MNIREILSTSPVMPVLVIDDLSQAIPLAQALCKGGLRVLEVALRTPCAIAAIAQISNAVPDAIVGAGTILQPEQFEEVKQAGAQFAVSPGFDPALCHASQISNLPYLPAVFTPSEAMAAAKLGFETLKLYPARESGGCNMLNALAGPFPNLKFCPSGGINAETAINYLSLDNVICVSGSWLTPVNLMKAGNWQHIQENAFHAAQLKNIDSRGHD